MSRSCKNHCEFRRTICLKKKNWNKESVAEKLFLGLSNDPNKLIGTHLLKTVVTQNLLFMWHNGFFNPFLVNDPILYSLKTPEKFLFSVVFRGYKMEKLAINRLNLTIFNYQFKSYHQQKKDLRKTFSVKYSFDPFMHNVE